MLCSAVQSSARTIALGLSSEFTNCASNSNAVHYLNLLGSLNSEHPSNSRTPVTPAEYRNFLKFLKTRDFRLIRSEQENSVTLDIISELVKIRPTAALNFMIKQISQHGDTIDRSQICKRKISALILQIDRETGGNFRAKILENTIVYLSRLNIGTSTYLDDLKPLLDFVGEHADAKQLFKLTGLLAEHAIKGYLSGDLHLRYIISNATTYPNNTPLLSSIQNAFSDSRIFRTTRLDVSIAPIKKALCYSSSIAVYLATIEHIHPMLSVMASIATLFTTMSLLTKRREIDVTSPAIRSFMEFIASLVEVRNK